MTEQINQINNEKIEKQEGNYRGYKRFGLILLIVFLMILSYGAGLYSCGRSELIKNFATKETAYVGKLLGLYSEAQPGVLGQDIDFNLFWKTWDALKQQYVDQEKLNDKKMFYGALKGMVASLGDPYTVFMDPVIAKDFSNDLAGTFEGIGAEIGIKNDVLTIIAPLPDMPAEKAGLKSGDMIAAINDESTQGMSVDEAVSKIRGPEKTEVVLSIARKGEDGVKKVSVIRGKIVVKSVRAEMRENDLMVITISNFNDDTLSGFNEAVRKTIDSGARGLIVDLRNNPGGYLDTAIEMASEWVEEGVVVTEKYSEEKKIEHPARGRARLKDMPTVVLVNEGSASASEIVAGALKDTNKAELVGKKTFGKGSVQTLAYLDDGSSIKITIAKWLTPLGTSINDEGVAVDHDVELTPEDYNAGKDPQMDKAVELLVK